MLPAGRAARSCSRRPGRPTREQRLWLRQRGSTPCRRGRGRRRRLARRRPRWRKRQESNRRRQWRRRGLMLRQARPLTALCTCLVAGDGVVLCFSLLCFRVRELGNMLQSAASGDGHAPTASTAQLDSRAPPRRREMFLSVVTNLIRLLRWFVTRHTALSYSLLSDCFDA